MSNSIELTANQLAALDQIIEQKKKGNEFIFGDIIHAVAKTADDVAHVVENAAPVVAAVTAVAAVGAVAGLSGEKLASGSLKDIVKNMPVESLIQVRKNATIKKG